MYMRSLVLGCVLWSGFSQCLYAQEESLTLQTIRAFNQGLQKYQKTKTAPPPPTNLSSTEKTQIVLDTYLKSHDSYQKTKADNELRQKQQEQQQQYQKMRLDNALAQVLKKAQLDPNTNPWKNSK